MVPCIIAGAAIPVAGAIASSAGASARPALSREHADNVAIGVFEGRTPCHPIATGFTGFPSAACERIKWEITLFRDRASGAPRFFRYDGTRTTRSGHRSIHRGIPSDPDAVVYRLTPRPTGIAISLLAIEDNVLLLLDERSRVMGGDAS